jgi:hypothetical protein
VLLLVSAPSIMISDTGDFRTYTDNNSNVLFNLTAEPVRIANNSAYISVKIEANESVNKTFKLYFENKEHIIKLNNNQSNIISTEDFSIESQNINKTLKIKDNETEIILDVKFKNINNLITQAQPTGDSSTIIINNNTGALQTAINNASINTILLENGTYWENVTIKRAVNIRAAPGAVPIINANEKNRVFTISSVDANISGLTITGGKLTSDDGGGINGSTVSNCTITGNIATRWGGGTYNSNVSDCTITGNTAMIGGGTYGGTVNNSLIANNSATSNSGGIRNSKANNCLITNNSASSAAGIGYSDNVTNCTITNNIATGNTSTGNTDNGGGADACTFTSCTITNNTAIYGGGIYRCYAIYCLIYNNTANNGTDCYQVNYRNIDFNW